MSEAKCEKCFIDLPQGVEFCPECGYPTPHLQPVTCPECQNLVVFSLDACPVCGLSYDDLGKRLAAEASVALHSAESIDIVSSEIGPGEVSDVTPAEGLTDEASVTTEMRAADEPVLHEMLANEITNAGMLSTILDRIAAMQNEIALTTAHTVMEKLVASGHANGRSADSNEEMAVTKIQEIVSGLSGEISSAVSEIKEANSVAVKELAAAAKQSATANPESAKPPAEQNQLLLYLCLVLVVFSILNLFITAYVVRLINLFE